MKSIGIQLNENYDLKVQVRRDASGMIVSGLQVGDVTYQNQALILSAQKGEIKESPLTGYGIKKIQRGGGTEKQALIEFDSLPRKIREALDDPRKDRHILEEFYRVDKSASTFFQEYEFEDGRHIDDYIIDEYIAIRGKI